jgi:hypothetical protein
MSKNRLKVSSDPNDRYFHRHFAALVEKHGGNWIVLVEGKLIGISKPKDVGKLILQAKAKHPHSIPFASPIPTREELECLL